LGRLRVLAGLEICQILEQNGFLSVRQRGSHRIMQKRTEITTITVPVPLHNPVRAGTLSSVIRQSGLPRSRIAEAVIHPLGDKESNWITNAMRLCRCCADL
jgi:predicted RNA binding protein YcfA (HicA-like mRNA interferase family)